MNLSTPAGRACRRSLPVAQACPFSITPYIPRRHFLSLRNKDPPRTEVKEAEEGTTKKAGLTKESRGPSVPSARLPLPLRKRIPKATDRNSGDLLESLFEQSVAPPSVVQDVPQNTKSSLDHYKNVEVLKSMLGRASPAESWNFFVKHFSPNQGSDSRHNLPS